MRTDAAFCSTLSDTLHNEHNYSMEAARGNESRKLGFNQDVQGAKCSQQKLKRQLVGCVNI